MDQSLNAEWCRSRAADCTKMAETTANAAAKAILEDMAAKWLRLAELTEKREMV
jgi:hypothetical protein